MWFDWKKYIGWVIIVILFGAFWLFLHFDRQTDYAAPQETIVLLGEAHGVKEFYDIELQRWIEAYKFGKRDLFLELPYYTGQLLNEFLRAPDDKILIELYNNLEGTSQHTDLFLNFFRNIKIVTPETRIHGTDLGHQYDSTGKRYLATLTKGTREYELTEEAINQGKTWYEELKRDPEYREEMMVKNFIRAFNDVDRMPILGVYGGYHVNVKNPKVMAGRLKNELGDIISVRFLSNQVTKTQYHWFSYVGIAFTLLVTVPFLILNKNKLNRMFLMGFSVYLILLWELDPMVLFKPGIALYFSDRFQWIFLAFLLLIPWFKSVIKKRVDFTIPGLIISSLLMFANVDIKIVLFPLLLIFLERFNNYAATH